MSKIKWILMNVDSTQVDTVTNKIIENGEMRRNINFLLDKGVKFTIMSKFHSNVISIFTKYLLLPNDDTFIISSHGSEIFSFKKKKVIQRFLIENKYIKDVEKILERVDFDFCRKIFVEITEKNGFTYLWNNNYKYFKNKVQEFEMNNKGIPFEIIDSVYKNNDFLNITITFLEEGVDVKKQITLLNDYNSNLSYKMFETNKIVITSKEAGVGICMDVINKNKNFQFNKDDIMSFSDSLSDIPALNKSSIAITVDGAPDEVKKAATNVFVGVENVYINEFLKNEISN